MSTMEAIEQTENNALAPIPQGKDAYALFTSGDTKEADRIIEIVRAKADAFMDNMPDITKASGRKEVKSFAYKVTRSKTLIDAEGKAVVDELKELPKKVDALRRYFKAELEAINEAVSKPVIEWEAAEKAREDAIKADLAELTAVIEDPHWPTRTAEALRDRKVEIELDFADVSEARFGEYATAAAELKFNAIASLETRIATREKQEAEAAELERLRKEAAERERQDRERKIAEEAAAKAKADAEAKAKAEADAAERREAELKAAIAKAAEDKRIAEERAAKAEQEAREKAAREAQEARQREEAAQRAREADKAHRASVNRAALEALTAGGIPEGIGQTVITLIATGKVPGVEIRY